MFMVIRNVYGNRKSCFLYSPSKTLPFLSWKNTILPSCTRTSTPKISPDQSSSCISCVFCVSWTMSDCSKEAVPILKKSTQLTASISTPSQTQRKKESISENACFCHVNLRMELPFRARERYRFLCFFTRFIQFFRRISFFSFSAWFILTFIHYQSSIDCLCFLIRCYGKGNFVFPYFYNYYITIFIIVQELYFSLDNT